MITWWVPLRGSMAGTDEGWGKGLAFWGAKVDCGIAGTAEIAGPLGSTRVHRNRQQQCASLSLPQAVGVSWVREKLRIGISASGFRLCSAGTGFHGGAVAPLSTGRRSSHLAGFLSPPTTQRLDQGDAGG